MSEDDDDYLSDKFLVDAAAAAAPKTYAQIRKEADKKAKLKNEQNRLKPRRQREVEARQEGLSKSLFERAKEEEDAGLTTGNKALSMMMKMGFKPGQSLGKPAEEPLSDALAIKPTTAPTVVAPSQPDDEHVSTPTHKKEPLALNEWTGKKGIGLGKRARSPTIAERVAKMAKMEENGHHAFRDRARQEYEGKRAESKLATTQPVVPPPLGPAQRTCTTLDEQAGKSFNVLWLNTNDPETIPTDLREVLVLHGHGVSPQKYEDNIRRRLRQQMQADALQPLEISDGSPEAVKSSNSVADQFPSEIVEEAAQFLRLHAQDRLHLVLSYLRDNYAYCFWCGVQYADDEELENLCPGEREDSHD